VPGHGAIVKAALLNSVWIPLMIFTFLYGLSMDYEVFMLSRIREAYDDWNRWMPSWTHTLLRVSRQEPSAQIAAETA
jgi:putative drug exporter of the RND superfamily